MAAMLSVSGHKGSKAMTDKPDVQRCAACGTEKPVSEMETCMHAQMHRYVCDMKCMNAFYNPPPKQALEPAGSYQKGYDEGRNQGTRHRVAEIQQLEAARASDKARIAELESALNGLLEIVSESTGVAGYHLNGDVALWDEFDDVSAADAALAQQGKENTDGQ
ncbi:hypothetical protein ACS8E9_09565 [Pseudomonas neustonica]|uniref:hypothetical protein n=1 Tax=Pseudomonas neustonica TaxID=2487346 RepID=UPI003F482364